VTSPRTILHLDLDAFYASVEQLDDPALRGRPVIVGGTSDRGVVCAASYEARRFGVRSAMPSVRARRLCPDGVFLSPRFERYGELSDQIFEIYRRYTPLVEPLSLDEAFLDVTASRALHGDGPTIARAIRAAVKVESGLTVSAGVAEVKLAAKIATDFGKPDGLTVVPAGGVAAFLAPLPVSRLWGVGPATEAALRPLGVARIGDLARLPEAALASCLGAERAHALRELARGLDVRDVVPDEAAHSVGGEETFEEDLVGEAAIARSLLLQAGRVGHRLRSQGLRGRIVTVKVKYADFTAVTRRVTLPRPTDDDAAIVAAARAQLSRVDLTRPVRLAGVTVSGFDEVAEAAPEAQLDLFGGPGGDPVEAGPPAGDEARRARLNAAVDKLSGRFGRGVVKPADLAGGAQQPPRSPRSLRSGLIRPDLRSPLADGSQQRPRSSSPAEWPRPKRRGRD
jgi:DNA polymerase IV